MTNVWKIVLLVAGLVFTSQPGFSAGPPEGRGSYNDLMAVYEEFLDYKAPSAWNANFNDPNAPNHGLVDYSVAANNERFEAITRLRGSMNNLNVAGWQRARQAEYLAVRAQLDAELFRLTVSRPWARDPGFYVDQLFRFTFTDLPVAGDELQKFERQLAAVPKIIEAAQANLDDVATDYARLAIRNLTTSDGVGHGHPYRAVPPAGSHRLV